MARLKIDLPEKYIFQTTIPIRITDLNYGGHLGNDSILTLVHEARIQFLQFAGYSEINFAGVGLIMADAAIEFKQEVFYGDSLQVSVVAKDFSAVGFDLYYLLEKTTAGKAITVAAVKTGMVCYDYSRKKLAKLPEVVKANLSAD